jgi:benzoyl-CoA reductase subunit C
LGKGRTSPSVLEKGRFVTLEEIVQRRHSYARQWKAETGGQVVGCLYSYVPEELIYAAGLLPVRVIPSHEPQDVTERHIATMYCPFSRSILAEALWGRYSYLDGLVLARTCIHMHQVFDSWSSTVPVSYRYFLDVPRFPEGGGLRYCIRELQKFRQSLQAWTGREITDQALREAIEIYETNRTLLRQLYQLRMADAPALSGVQAQTLVLSSMLMDKATHNRLLAAALADLRSRQHANGSRLMVVGNANVNTEILELIESLGATVVIDDESFGSRYFWESRLPAALDDDPLTFLASYYLGKPPCSTKDFSEHRRLGHILRLVRDYRVEGVIFLYQKFCHPYLYDHPYVEKILKQAGISSLLLELDTTLPRGQVTTRLEAFLETLW